MHRGAPAVQFLQGLIRRCGFAHAFAVLRAVQGSWRSGVGIGVVGALLLVWYLGTETVPRDFTSMTPYVTTLLVLALGAQRLRMPAADAQPYRRGSAG